MNWHVTLLLLNVISISLILGMAWLMVFKMPRDVQEKWWHTSGILLLLGGFITRVAAIFITVYALGSAHFD